MISARRLLFDAKLPDREAELLLLHVVGKDRVWLFAHGDEAIPESTVDLFWRLVEQRRAGRPIAYLTGQRAFWTMNLEVSDAVLIPRPDTEILVEWALEIARQTHAQALLDMGTGSGAIALALALELPACAVTAVDVSESALAVAARNAHAHGASVQFVRSDWYRELDGQWPLIVSNPPYIRGNDPHLLAGDLPAEPRAALVGGPDGLDCLRTLISGSDAVLTVGGALLVEHGWDQAPAVRELFTQAGFVNVGSRRDIAGHERVTGGYKPC